MVILFLLALLVYYDFGVPHPTNVSTVMNVFPGGNQTLNYSGNFSYVNYTRLLTDYNSLVTLIVPLISSFQNALAIAYHRGLIIGIFAGLFIGFLFGTVLEGIRRKKKTT